MSNPYEPSPSEAASDQPLTPCPSAWSTILYGLGGAFVGFLFLTMLASIEVWPFYTIRSTLIGESAMSRIVAHPADRWIVLGLTSGFILVGTFAGLRLARGEHYPSANRDG